MKFSIYILFLFIGFVFFSCNNNDTEPLIEADIQAEREDQIIQQYLAENNLTAQAQKTDLGIYYIVLEEGEGTVISNDGASVVVNYEGSVLYGRQFDSSYERGEPLTFTIGAGSVVAGFNEAVKQMKRQEKTLFFIPSRYAYGQQGISSSSGEVIPPFATLVFEIRREI
ncbi:FKBP-type peptidyl-prolyl cis-trans isomerase [Bernardetia sp.]|uniref:FKBP-type peptidyl-prolyl cis-trans isomerase n=1 Tax=Bernardetia sp. TaxID=1937974 RepID=UPI0025BE04AB|nr:FKBP-type peptidyl-prolyl cis-trans isomerase [Bernardetia sp.]